MKAAQAMPGGASLASVLGTEAAVVVGEDRLLTGLSLDSHKVRPGYLFLACRGQRHHGLEFVEEAIRRGAVAVAYEPEGAEHFLPTLRGIPAYAIRGLAQHAGLLAARFYGDPSANQRVMAVTGTNGKTSVSLITAQVLEDLDHACGLLGTLGYGLHGNLSTPTHTTPDAVEIQAWLARFHAQGARHVSMEASSHALEQGRLVGTHIEVAVFTNLTRDHLDYHGDMYAYGAAKRRLFETPALKHAVINLDDAFGRELVATLPQEVALTGYSVEGVKASRGRSLHASGVSLHPGGMNFDVSGDWGTGHVDSRLLGSFNVANLLAALGALLALDIPFNEAVPAISRARTVPGRMECFGGGAAQPLVVVDYAHTPDALEKALTAARAHCRGQLWCVFGCGGERDRGKRPEMGRIAEALADRVVVTDDNPRNEEGDAIVADILDGMQRRVRIEIERDRARAVVQTVQAAAPGDVVLVAGKGHEDYQIIGDKSVPYSDRATVAALFKQARA